MNDLTPPTIRKAVLELESLFEVTQKELEAWILKWDGKALESLLDGSETILAKLDQDVAVKVRQVIHKIVLFEYRAAERRLALPALRISETAMAAIDRSFILGLRQHTDEVRQSLRTVIENGFKLGMSLEDKRAFQQAIIDTGIKGIVRADGSQLSLEATGKTIVRTSVNRLQAESQISRYNDGGVEKVQFVSGGFCRFNGEGGTCTDLDGEIFPISDIPDWARIPRHPYSQSRWLPVTSE